MFGFAWVTVAAEDLHVCSQFPEPTFARYEAPGAESKDEYQLRSVDFNIPTSDTAP
jgi:hypothetical protein